MNTQLDNPQNDLESALIAGVEDAAARPIFYETLLKSQVLIVPAGEAPSIVAGVVQADTKLSLSTIEIDGERHVPFFSSEARLPVGTSFLGLSAIDFFQLTKGSNLVLNPGSNYGKIFLPDEVASLLDGSLFRPVETLTAKGGEQQLIGQPKDYPHKFAAAVARLLASEPSVEQAFLAQHFIAGMHTQPAILVAIVAPESGFEQIAGAIGVIAKEMKEMRDAKKEVDITRLQKANLGYFSSQTPIYERKKKSFLSGLFG
jgi:hypothetical protein